MTQEEKVKRYDEALHKAKNYYSTTDSSSDIKLIGLIFPELKESDDEKIRKALVEMVHDTTGDSLWIDYNVHKEDALAWLEKQGEQKSVKFKPLFKFGDIIKPKDPALGEPRIIKGIYPKFGYDTNNGILDFEFEDNWELVEKNPAWSEEDERIYKVVLELIDSYSKGTIGGCIIPPNVERYAKWFKSLKDRVQPQPKQEWSEQDERTYKSIIYSFAHNYPLTVQQQEFIKSLKDRYTWKPSDEQMNNK